MSWRWYLEDLRELRLYARLAGALRRASADGRDTCATLVADEAQRHPDRPLLRFEGTTLDRGAFDAEVNRCAHWLAAEGVRRGDVVAIAMQNRPAFCVAQAAAAKVGAIAALVNHQLAGRSLEHVLATAGARLVLTDEPTAAAVVAAAPAAARIFADGARAALPERVGSMVEALAASDARSFPIAPLRGGDVFLYIYTSGTTGLPKPAVIRHMRFTMAGIALSGIYGIGADDCVYAPLPLYHGQSNFVGFAVALRSGGAFASRARFRAGDCLADLERHGATMLVYVGELCRYLLALPPGPADRAHRLRVAAGAGLRPDVWARFQQRFGIERIFEMYGATEGNVNLMNRTGRVGSVGRPQPFQHAQVALARFDVATGALVRGADGWIARCADGEPGELLGRVGRGVIQYDGYVDPEASERKLVRDAFRRGDAWFRTGDLLRRDADGYYYFVDRAGDTFRWKGENVATQEVAEVINGARGVAQSVVYGVELPGAEGRAGMAAVVLAHGVDRLDGAAHYAHAAAHLPRYALPAFVRVVASLAVTGTMKERKVDLRADGWDPARTGEDAVYVRDDDARAYVALDASRLAALRAGSLRL